MEFNAFDAGIEPGGLRNSNQIKVLICFLVNNASEPLSKEQICDIMQSEGIANYFEVSESVVKLDEQGCISSEISDGTKYYTITKTGLETLESLESLVPPSVRDKAAKKAESVILESRRRRENDVKIERRNGQIIVTFTVYDGPFELMKLSMPAINSEQAELMKENFYRNPTLLYSSVVSILIEGVKP